jgi:hypothetical protein
MDSTATYEDGLIEEPERRETIIENIETEGIIARKNFLV